MSGYDAWLEAPYLQAAREEERWEKAEEEAALRGDGTSAQDVIGEWDREEEAAFEAACRDMPEDDDG